jgi:PAS domain-containing protein
MALKTVDSAPASRAALATLADAVDDALLLFDDHGVLGFCNRAAMRLLGAEPGLAVAQLSLGDEGVRWLRERLAVPRMDAGVRLTLPGGRSATLSCWPVARGLGVRAQPGPAALSEPFVLPAVEGGPTLEMLRMLWASPFPATLQDRQFRLVAVNEAYLSFTGRVRDALIGSDPVELQPLEDRASHIESRRELPRMLEGQNGLVSATEEMVRHANRARRSPHGVSWSRCVVQWVTKRHRDGWWALTASNLGSVATPTEFGRTHGRHRGGRTGAGRGCCRCPASHREVVPRTATTDGERCSAGT